MPTSPTSIDGPAVAIETHGCKLNQADSSALAWQFMEAGYRLVRNDDPADVYVVNTCTVTHVADRKGRHALRAARRRNPDATIVAAGCYSQRAPEELRRLEHVDLVFGNTDKGALVREVTEWRGETPVPCAVGEEADAISPRILRTRAMVKIQEGCNQVCAYCIVPKVRGRERSVPPGTIVGEINRYADRGYKEAVLTGTQLGSYGFDIPGMTLTTLIERILSETPIHRLRISSLQPQEIDPQLLGLWSDRRLCPHFHLPLQSGSDAVLKRMRRRYSAARYAETVDAIRRAVPGAAVTADAIVGFPGETDDEFEETYALCRSIGFADMHVFPYSVRPGTSAAHLGGHVHPDVKSKRMQSLLTLAETKALAFRQGLLGSVRAVLWEEAGGSGRSLEWTGLTDNYVRVLTHSVRPLTNQITPARLVPWGQTPASGDRALRAGGEGPASRSSGSSASGAPTAKREDLVYAQVLSK